MGDVVGRPGRQALQAGLKHFREVHSPDFVMINGENAAGGNGLTKKIFDQFVGEWGVDCITMGNHWADKREIYDFRHSPQLVLPANMGNTDEDSDGLRIFKLKSGRELAVMNVIGKIFMHEGNRCPFKAIDRLTDRVPSYIKMRVLDIHAEATSEKQGMGQYLAGKASLVYGTHSHVPTADERILKGSTGFVTDLGMTGPYDSVIGVDATAAIRRLRTGEKKGFDPAKDDLRVFAILAEIDENTGGCSRIERLRFRVDHG
jgi:metallophosphoesterase (TIGR00282 family)